MNRLSQKTAQTIRCHCLTARLSLDVSEVLRDSEVYLLPEPWGAMGTWGCVANHHSLANYPWDMYIYIYMYKHCNKYK